MLPARTMMKRACKPPQEILDSIDTSHGCTRCGNPNAILLRRYTECPDEVDNWSYLCDDDRAEDDEYYLERWADYYADLL